ncbi:MAG: inosamine-phosphate amidinotransferase 1 [Lentisphaerae bacterium]|nr:inosamine-phosphate amidinotransferase 1 [Lentisphaerota bacterium]
MQDAGSIHDAVCAPVVNGPAAAKVAVHTHTEWGRLREVVVGIAEGARIPTVKDVALHSINYGHLSDAEFARVPTGSFPPRVIEEATEDLEDFAQALRGLGIGVHRPRAADFSERHTTPDWSVDGCHAYCPRDTILTVGQQAIETPMVLRHRQTEARLYRHLVDTVRAPVPRLLDSLYDYSTLGVPTLRNEEPAFDAANCLKFGRDILFLISNTGNEAGREWLQAHLGPAYRVHPVRDVYSFVHIDSTIIPLRPGLVLLNPARVNETNIPAYFKSWDKLYAPEPDEVPFEPGWCGASKWIALNCLSLAPDLVAVEQGQTGLMRVFERHGLQCLPVRMRHARTMGGGLHCVTLDLVREGPLEDYA